jgi:uncharacterized protein (TIGR00290 family)
MPVQALSNDGSTTTPVALSWSGGKDSALALWTLRASGVEPAALLTTVTEPYDRVSIHGVRRSLLLAQSAAAGVRLVEVTIPQNCTNDVYERRLAGKLTTHPTLSPVGTYAFGDLFLEDIRGYRERQFSALGKRAIFPLWKRDTATLARSFLDAEFDAIMVCVDPAKLDPSFAGRRYDQTLLEDLPHDVDPCGENGEFHTFVTAGPTFTHPINCHTGTIVTRDGFVYCDLLPT